MTVVLTEKTVPLGSLTAVVVGSFEDAVGAVVLMHGHGMRAADLAPFARSLKVPMVFVFPEGPLAVEPAGRAWWAIDAARRAAALRNGPRDLADEYAPGRPHARQQLGSLLEAIRGPLAGRPLVLGGFSQGGMLACDQYLMEDTAASALVALSASRIARTDWAPRLGRLCGLPAFVSHGRSDPDLAFSAGEGLRDCLAAGGASVTWLPFDGGHVIPLEAWRGLRRFLTGLSDSVTHA